MGLFPSDSSVPTLLDYLPPCSWAIGHIWVILLVGITPVPSGGYGWSRGVAVAGCRVIGCCIVGSSRQSPTEEPKPKTEAESGSVSTVPTSITSSSAVVLGR
jgi:hypothetical protein